MKENLEYRNRIYNSYTSLYSPDIDKRAQSDLESTSRSIISNLREWLPKSKDAECLDVACGTGALLFALNKVGYRKLCGVDCSPEQVSHAKLICEDVRLGDAISYLSENRERFDFITAIDIIEHLGKEEVIMFVDALHQALKPGGRLVIQTPNADSPWVGNVRYGDFTHELCFTPESLSHILKSAGFVSYVARECRPYIHGLKSLLRALLWQAIRWLPKAWNIIETGGVGSGVYTRVFMAKVDRPL